MQGGVSDSVPPVRSDTGPTGASLLRLGQLPRRPRHHDGPPQPPSSGGGGDRRIPAARHRRIRARDGAHPARRLLEDEDPRHRRTGAHREPGSGRTTLPVSRRSAVSGWSMATSSCPRPGQPTANKTRRHAALIAGSNSFHSRRRSWRGSRKPRDQARMIRASGPSGCGFALSIRSIGSPSNRRVPALSRPCTFGTCFRSSGPIDHDEVGRQKSPAHRRASLFASDSGQSVPAQSSTSRCASSRVLPYFF